MIVCDSLKELMAGEHSESHTHWNYSISLATMYLPFLLQKANDSVGRSTVLLTGWLTG